MQIIPIQSIPNQTFNITLDDNQWDIGIRAANGATAISVSLNGTALISNLRAVSGMRVLPSEYKESGNFTFITLNQELLDYSKFGVSQYLVYISAEELVDVRSVNPAIIKESDFDTTAPLPLRFKTQGYQLV